MRIELTGIAADLNNEKSVDIPVVEDVSALKAELIKKIPDLIRYSYQVCVNHNKALDHQKISQNDHILIILPFAGG